MVSPSASGASSDSSQRVLVSFWKQRTCCLRLPVSLKRWTSSAGYRFTASRPDRKHHRRICRRHECLSRNNAALPVEMLARLHAERDMFRARVRDGQIEILDPGSEIFFEFGLQGLDSQPAGTRFISHVVLLA